jgi:hypothetical protein
VALEGLGPKRFSTHNLPINLEKESMPWARAKIAFHRGKWLSFRNYQKKSKKRFGGS